MTVAEVIQILTAVGVLVGVILSGIAAIVAAKAKQKAVETHDAVNSRMDEFKRLFEQSFVARGRLAERTEADERKADHAAAHPLEPVEVKVVEGPGVDTPLKVADEGKQKPA